MNTNLKAIPRKIVLDVDTGVDDALAILLAIADPNLEILGLTTVTGNTDCSQAAKNTRFILSQCGREAVPLAKGAVKSLSGRQAQDASHVHGTDGLGGVSDAFWSKVTVEPVFPEDATDVLIQAAQKHGRDVTIVATGPLTNIANAIIANPDAMNSIGGISVMGGAFHRGNVTPYAEFNANFDPVAFATVLHSDLEITLFPLDVTEQVTLGPHDLEFNLTGPLQELVQGITGKYIDFHAEVDGFVGFYVHDAMPVIALSQPSLFTFEMSRVEIVTHPENTRYYGQTVRVLPPCDGRHVRIAMDCKVTAVKQLIWSMLRTLQLMPDSTRLSQR